MVMFDGAEVLDVAGPLEVFNVANTVVQQTQPLAPASYVTSVLACSKGPINVSSGLRLCVDQRLQDFQGPVDTLFVAGGTGVQAASRNTSLVKWLKTWASKARRVASVCTGTFLLAEAGLLDGKRVTTHWAAAEELQRQFPSVSVDADSLFIRAGNIYTSAGVTAGIDLALAMVEEDLGREVSLAIARGLVVFLRRPGGQKQFSHHLRSQTQSSSGFANLVDWLISGLDKSISVESMAKRCSMSPRHFARLFRQELRVTPAKFLEQLRLEKARLLLEQNILPIKAVAASCGFTSSEQFRRSFQRNLHTNPCDYHTHF